MFLFYEHLFLVSYFLNILIVVCVSIVGMFKYCETIFLLISGVVCFIKGVNYEESFTDFGVFHSFV